MRRLVLTLVLAAGCSRFEPEAGGRTVEGATDPPLPNPPQREPRPPPGGRDGGPPLGSPQCFPLTRLPADCAAVGQWRLTHGQPDSPCPFGASRHDVRLFEIDGSLCLEPVDDFQILEPGDPGTCTVVLSGQHGVGAASVPYTELWTSWLNYAAGTGETQVVIKGGSNCMRKFQTTIERK